MGRPKGARVGSLHVYPKFSGRGRVPGGIHNEEELTLDLDLQI